MNPSSITKSLLAVLTLASGVAASTGCSAPPVEGRGSSTSKLLAPRAMFKGAASAETASALGITEWRIYRGKTQYVLTGYSSTGKAVKGVSLQFVAHSGSTGALLKGKVLDGTHFAGTHEFGGTTKTTGAIGALSKTFVSHAVSDLVALRQGLKTSITRSAIHTGEACGGDLVKVTMNAVQCIADANSSGSSLSKQLKVKQCVAAAQSASDAVASCQNTGATTAPAADKAAADKAPAASSKGSSSGGSKGSNSADDQKAADAKQDAQQDKADDAQTKADQKQDAQQDADDAKKEAADAKQDAEQDKQDNTQTQPDPNQDQQQNDTQAQADAQQDQQATSSADSAGQDTTCTSCDGTGSSDIQADPSTGAVSSADAGSDTSGDTGSAGTDTGGDTGGSTGGDTTEA